MKKILIVDDSLIMRLNLKKILEKEGYDVVAEATNGQDAVDKYIKFQPDLTTMDITMPVLDGITALKKIKSIDENACVVMISALGQEMKIIEALNSGARHYIVKPLNEIDVANKIADVLNSSAEEYSNAVASR
jgi:two-component system chemotaxis response regulator CheY